MFVLWLTLYSVGHHGKQKSRCGFVYSVHGVTLDTFVLLCNRNLVRFQLNVVIMYKFLMEIDFLSAIYILTYCLRLLNMERFDCVFVHRPAYDSDKSLS